LAVLRRVTSLTAPSGPVVNGECSLSLRKLSRRQPAAWWGTLMAEIKFSCPQCGQHISGNEQWSGRQIQCPACATTLTVPGAPPAPVAAATVPQSLVPQPPVSHGAKLSAGATQVPRSAVPGPVPLRQLAARPPRRQSPLLKYVGYAIVLAALGGAGYLFLPSLLSKIQDSANSKPTQAAPAANSGGAGPLGEVNAAMDVSESLDGGSSAQPRPVAVQQPVAAQTPAAPAARPAVRSTNDTSRARSRQPGRIGPASGGQQ
jgi:DNA-directed RNA polymerase subunit RPC12/RpoP